MNSSRLSLQDILGIKLGETKYFLLDWMGQHIARQLVYNRKRVFPGCDIDVSVSYRISNADDKLYTLAVTRKAYGKTVDGFDEPKEYKEYDYSIATARRSRKGAGKKNC